MKEKDSRGISWRNCLAVVIILVVLAGIGVATYFAVSRWWSDNTVSNAPQPFEVAILLLTLLVAIVAIFVGYTSITTKNAWEKFEKEQEPIIKDLQTETKEMNWLDQLRKSMKDDPQLDTPKAKETIRDLKEHYFERDQYNEAWKYFGVARWYEDKERYDLAIEYCEKADKVNLEEDNIDANKLYKHIRQSLGLNYFYRGIKREENHENKKAIKDYETAIFYYDWVIKYDSKFAMAHLNKAVTLIQLGKIKGDKTKPYNDANYCFNEAIKCLKTIEANYDHFYDKARAHALLNQPDEAIKSLKRSFVLAKRDKLGDLIYNLKRDHEDFKNVEGQEEFEELLKRYRDSYKGTN